MKLVVETGESVLEVEWEESGGYEGMVASILAASTLSTPPTERAHGQHRVLRHLQYTDSDSDVIAIRSQTDVDEFIDYLHGTQAPPHLAAIMQSEERLTHHPSKPQLAGSPRRPRSIPTITIKPNIGQIKSWAKGQLLGSGSSGKVYLGIDNNTGDLFAIKEILFLGESESTSHNAKREIELMKPFTHTNIVQYLGAQETSTALHVMMEYVPGGSISSLLAKLGAFGEPIIRLYTTQICAGLRYLHGMNILHRDIKGGNCLVGLDGTVKLADFGCSVNLSVESGGDVNSVTGTSLWMSPEAVKCGEGITLASDIWSLGCTIVEMGSGRPPWDDAKFVNEWAAMYYISTTESGPPIPRGLSRQAHSWLSHCFKIDHNERAELDTLLCHPFLTESFSEQSTDPDMQPPGPHELRPPPVFPTLDKTAEREVGVGMLGDGTASEACFTPLMMSSQEEAFPDFTTAPSESGPLSAPLVAFVGGHLNPQACSSLTSPYCNIGSPVGFPCASNKNPDNASCIPSLPVLPGGYVTEAQNGSPTLKNTVVSDPGDITEFLKSGEFNRDSCTIDPPEVGSVPAYGAGRPPLPKTQKAVDAEVMNLACSPNGGSQRHRLSALLGLSDGVVFRILYFLDVVSLCETSVCNSALRHMIDKGRNEAIWRKIFCTEFGGTTLVQSSLIQNWKNYVMQSALQRRETINPRLRFVQKMTNSNKIYSGAYAGETGYRKVVLKIEKKHIPFSGTMSSLIYQGNVRPLSFMNGTPERPHPTPTSTHIDEAPFSTPSSCPHSTPNVLKPVATPPLRNTRGFRPSPVVRPHPARNPRLNGSPTKGDRFTEGAVMSPPLNFKITHLQPLNKDGVTEDAEKTEKVDVVVPLPEALKELKEVKEAKDAKDCLSPIPLTSPPFKLPTSPPPLGYSGTPKEDHHTMFGDREHCLHPGGFGTVAANSHVMNHGNGHSTAKKWSSYEYTTELDRTEQRKREERREMSSLLLQDYKFLKELSDAGVEGVLAPLWFGPYSGGTVLALPAAGPSLNDLLLFSGNRFSCKTVCLIALRALKILEDVHNEGIVHGNVSPSNILLKSADPDEPPVDLVLVNFSSARCWRDKKTLKMTSSRSSPKIRSKEQLFFSSVHVQMECTSSPRDDLVSLAYMLFFFYHGHLPWLPLHEQSFRPNAQKGKEMIASKKKFLNETKSHPPLQLHHFLKYTSGIRANQSPDYSLLVNLVCENFEKGDSGDCTTVATQPRQLHYSNNLSKEKGGKSPKKIKQFRVMLAEKGALTDPLVDGAWTGLQMYTA